MLRRFSVTARLAPRALAASLLTSAPTRLQSTDANSSADSSTNNTNRVNRRPSLAQQRARRAQLPPAFDIVHWNDNDIRAGHLLRVLHRDSFVVLDYHRQSRRTTEEGNKAERAVSVMLPAVYIARFLSVLEGRSATVEVQSRFTNAVFAPVPEASHTYRLHCKSTRPPQQQQQQQEEETLEWTVDFDPAESLMLHRFLTQALHYNTGFARTTL